MADKRNVREGLVDRAAWRPEIVEDLVHTVDCLREVGEIAIRPAALPRSDRIQRENSVLLVGHVAGIGIILSVEHRSPAEILPTTPHARAVVLRGIQPVPRAPHKRFNANPPPLPLTGSPPPPNSPVTSALLEFAALAPWSLPSLARPRFAYRQTLL
jgi:hypothetical protein